jgi:hypothetical protein
MADMLYYPDTVPPPDVTAHAVLYWDRLRSIHNSRDDAPSALEPLHDTGLYRKLPLDRDSDIPLKVMKKISKYMKTYDPADLTFTDQPLYGVHPGRRGQEFWNSFIGVPWRSLQIMSFTYDLGKIGAEERDQLGDGRLVPHTMDRQLLHIAQKSGLWSASEQSAGLQVHLGKLLPSPREDVPLAKLIKFRQKYEDERAELMAALNDLFHEMSCRSTDPDDTLRQCAQRLREATRDFRKAGRARRIAWVRNSVAVTVATGSAGLAAMHQNLAWVLGVISGYAINVATANIGTPWTPGPYSYLHRATAAVT